MKAAYYYGIRDIRLEETAIPTISDDEVLIKVHVTAICGTDLRIYKFGHFKIPEGQKRVLGHEIAGEIVQVGKNVKGYEVGTRVAIPPNVGCGTCHMCLKGMNQMCPDYEAFGISYDGGFEEYMRVTADAVAHGNLIRIPDALSYEEAAMCEPLGCTYNSYQALKTVPGDTVLIIGAGPIGACHVMINRLAGGCKIIVADVSDERLEQIKQFGADYTINSGKEDLNQFVMDLTNGEGANVVITACSVPDVLNQALSLAAIHARVNFFGGMPKGKEIVGVDTSKIHYKELKVLGTTGCNYGQFYETLQIAASGRINLKPLATHRFSLDQINEAFEHALSGKGMKTLIVNE